MFSEEPRPGKPRARDRPLGRTCRKVAQDLAAPSPRFRTPATGVLATPHATGNTARATASYVGPPAPSVLRYKVSAVAQPSRSSGVVRTTSRTSTG